MQFNQISISFYFFQSFFKKYFDRSQKYRSFSVYFICFLTELSFSKLVRSIKSVLLLSKKTIDFFYKIVIEKIVRSVKTCFLIFLNDPIVRPSFDFLTTKISFVFKNDAHLYLFHIVLVPFY